MNIKDIEERLEALERTIDELIILNSQVPVIVEGEKDEQALRELGLTGRIVKVNTGSPIFNVCEDISRNYREVVILTDWDRAGGHLAELLRHGLEANDVKYNLEIRARLSILCKKEIKDVQSLPNYMGRLRKREHSNSKH